MIDRLRFRETEGCLFEQLIVVLLVTLQEIDLFNSHKNLKLIQTRKGLLRTLHHQLETPFVSSAWNTHSFIFNSSRARQSGQKRNCWDGGSSPGATAGAVWPNQGIIPLPASFTPQCGSARLESQFHSHLS